MNNQLCQDLGDFVPLMVTVTISMHVWTVSVKILALLLTHAQRHLSAFHTYTDHFVLKKVSISALSRRYPILTS